MTAVAGSAGHARSRIVGCAGVARVPVIVRETTPQQLLELALIENVQRADLNPLEEAQAYESLKAEFGLGEIERRPVCADAEHREKSRFIAAYRGL